MDTKLLNRLIRFDSLESFKLENTTNIFFKYKTDTPKKNDYNNQIVFEKDINNGVLWINKKLLNYIQNYYFTTSETDTSNNFEYVIKDLEYFFSSNTEFQLSENRCLWNPSRLELKGFEIRIASETKYQKWVEINSKLINIKK